MIANIKVSLIIKIIKYKNYCSFINTISKNKLLATTPEERSEFFKSLESLLHFKKTILKNLVSVDKKKYVQVPI